MGGYEGAVDVSSTRLADRLKVSQQTAARRLQDLEKEGLIIREITAKGQNVRITKEGVKRLWKVYVGLKKIFEEKPQTVRIRGEIFSGMGEGRYYVSVEGYRRCFEEKLGFTPYPGTLNLKLKSYHDVQTRKLLEAYPGIIIEEFEEGGRTFGRVKCFKALIEGKIEGSVLLINRTHYGEDVIEVISPVFLRETLNLKDGENVTVYVILE
ncbi:MAG: CTP-dependent riboflavin kinase [Candidatus Freyarchaeota archaeon]|nr:CTP-dependent riboflavin kinase [Candidatus Jordarchaeia archaeon]